MSKKRNARPDSEKACGSASLRWMQRIEIDGKRVCDYIWSLPEVIR
ncbi:hypothetical protein [Burkholderia oklahomensis]|nr:hypothetical protein [Burkholderia oklahomensis]MBI0362893.1 hypothetical protein [Burkholderia oklahomensis]QPS40437.1 hypothetical protein I6G57_32390 [Burkholderia oklahomensis]